MDGEVEDEESGLLLWEIETTSGPRLVATDDEIGVRLLKRDDDGAGVSLERPLSNVPIAELEIAQQMAEDLDAATKI